MTTLTEAPAAPATAGRRDKPWLSLIAVAFGLFMVGLDGSIAVRRYPLRGVVVEPRLGSVSFQCVLFGLYVFFCVP